MSNDPKSENYQKHDAPFSSTRGVPVWDDNNSVTVGSRGDTVLSDTYLIEKLAHFNRERIPERVVHAKGAGAFGTFYAYGNARKYTMAAFLNDTRPTRTFTRFSTVAGSKGSADTVRDPRGFATKFYTSQGNYDLVGNNLPVFFIRDGIKFPDFIHALKASPDTNRPDPERFWDFISNTPEATHMITWVYSDRGTVKSYRKMDGFGVSTFVFVNENGERRLAKLHLKGQQGIETIDRHEMKVLAGQNPDIATQDLWEAIKRGDYPKYELCVQLIEMDAAKDFPFDPLDDTKTWPEDVFPLIKLGMLTLDKNPDNFFAVTEQAAFCPGNVVPGIELSADKMLTARSFGYSDTQRYRLGANFMQLPVNRPVVPTNNFTQDGPMAYDYREGKINYYPNRYNMPSIASHPDIPGPQAEGRIERAPIEKQNDFYQAGERYNSLSQDEQCALCGNIAVELKLVSPKIAAKVLSYFHEASPEFAQYVLQMMKADVV